MKLFYLDIHEYVIFLREGGGVVAHLHKRNVTNTNTKLENPCLQDCEFDYLAETEIW